MVGIVCTSAITYLLAHRRLNCTYLFDNIVYAVLAGIIGARLTYILLYPEQFSSLNDMLFIWEGGLVSYGGFILGGLALAVILKYQREPVLEWLDILAISFPVGIMFGRIGDIFAGEYFGVATQSKLSLGGVVPVTLYEAIWDLMIFCVLFFCFRFSTKNYPRGTMLALTCGLYGGGRFVIDFWRDESDFFLRLSPGQVTSLMIAVISTVYLATLIAPIMKGKNNANNKDIFRKATKNIT